MQSMGERRRIRRLQQDLDALEATMEEERELEEALGASPVAQALVAVMEERSVWEGSPGQLLGELNDTADAIRTAGCQSAPLARINATTGTATSSICTLPPITRLRPSRHNSSSENSNPIENNSKNAPAWATYSISCSASRTQPRHPLPTSTPTSKYPTTTEMRSDRHSRPPRTSHACRSGSESDRL